jgi:hypothetical protein
MSGDKKFWSYGTKFTIPWPVTVNTVPMGFPTEDDLDRSVEALIDAFLEESVKESDCNTARNMLADIGIQC